MRIKGVFIALLLCSNLFSQGVYITDYKLNNKAERWCNSISQDKSNNMLFAVAQGVVVFDGINEQLVKTPFTPKNIIADTVNNNVIICGYKTIGSLVYNGSNLYKYKTITSIDSREFRKILIINDTIYCASNNSIVIIDAKTLTFIDELVVENSTVEHFFEYNNKPHFIADFFIYKIQNNKIIELNNNNFPVDDFAFVIQHNNELLLGTHNSSYYTFNNKVSKNYSISNHAFFKNNYIVDAKSYLGNHVLLASLAGGISIVDYQSRKVKQHVNFFSGLPDDEIKAIYIDNQKGVWVAHQFGISRIDFNINIDSYQNYPGLKGSPLAVKNYDNKLYVSTNDGVYTLYRVNDYNEVTIKIDVPVDVTVEVAAETTSNGDIETADEQEKKESWSLFNRKRKNKEKEEKPKANIEPLKTQTITKTIKKTETRVIKKRSLNSISHVYKPVTGIDDKCKQFAIFDNKLLASGNKALYYINGTQASKILNNVYIVDIYVNNKLDAAYCSTNNGLYKVWYKNGKWEILHFAQTTGAYINSITYTNKNTWAIAFENSVALCNLINDKIKIITDTELPETPGSVFLTNFYNDSVFVFTDNTIYHYTQQGQLNTVKTFENQFYSINTQSNYNWIFDNGVWDYFNANEQKLPSIMVNKLRLFDNLRYIDVDNNNNIYIITEQNQIAKIGPSKLDNILFTFDNSKIKIGQHEANPDKLLRLPAKNNNVSMNFSAPFYLKQNGVEFTYYLTGLDNNWSMPQKSTRLNLKYLPSGKFILQTKAKNALGQVIDGKNVNIKVAKPFSQTVLFYVIIIVLGGGVSYLVFKTRLKKLENDKQLLEQKVVERTKTIEEQKKDIEKQHDEIKQSIRYAQRIQQAMLPHPEIMEAMLPEHFVLFMPRDIVSGDFYFFKPIGKYLVFVAADCTGHGVPGAFMSMLGISFLNEITSTGKVITAAEIINSLRTKIKNTLGQTDKGSTTKDGMDLAITLIDTENNTIQFAGAFNPLLIIRNNEVITIKADRQPVAVYFKEVDFTNNIIEVQKDDIFYMFSDGFTDQIGGSPKRKYLIKNFRELLLNNHAKPMPEQRNILEKTIVNYMAESGESQMDDILVVGFKII